MCTIHTDVFAYDELTDQAKEKARDAWRKDAFDYDWWESVYEMASTAAGLLGIDLANKSRQGVAPAIYFSCGYSQSDYASFEGFYEYRKGAAKAIRAEFPTDKDLHAIAAGLQDVQRRNFYKLQAECKCSNYGGLSVDVTHAESRYKDIGDAESEIRDLLRDFAQWIYRALRDEYEYLNSDDCIAEGILANGIEFTEEGEIA